jgi:D-glycero-alpha-D-manno-heptose-7-phosphate kinase
MQFSTWRMIFRSKAPLRIGLAGGGTDVSPYSDKYGGAVVNAAIGHFAHAEIQTIPDRQIILHSADRNEIFISPINEILPVNGSLDILKGIYNRMLQDYGPFSSGFRLSTRVDAPLGSGLGTSSTLMVALTGVFCNMLGLDFNGYQTAHYAYRVERMDLGFAGGKQDQYAAAFGGVNYMEFFEEDKVSVSPLNIETGQLQELENKLILFYTSTSRDSTRIIQEQQQHVRQNDNIAVEAMHALKEQSKLMKNALLTGNLDSIGEILDYGFMYKRKMARDISNPLIEEIYHAAKKAGSTGGKISGAGGGGFMIFYCPANTRNKVCDALHNFGGSVKQFTFCNQGLITWRSDEHEK